MSISINICRLKTNSVEYRNTEPKYQNRNRSTEFGILIGSFRFRYFVLADPYFVSVFGISLFGAQNEVNKEVWEYPFCGLFLAENCEVGTNMNNLLNNST